VAEQLDRRGIAFFDLRHANHAAVAEEDLARIARRAYGGALMRNGGFDQASGEAALAAGTADAIIYGKPFIANPTWWNVSAAARSWRRSTSPRSIPRGRKATRTIPLSKLRAATIWQWLFKRIPRYWNRYEQQLQQAFTRGEQSPREASRPEAQLARRPDRRTGRAGLVRLRRGADYHRPQTAPAALINTQSPAVRGTEPGSRLVEPVRRRRAGQPDKPFPRRQPRPSDRH